MESSNTQANVDGTPLELITDNIEIWTSAIQARSSAGRGRRKKLDLYGVKRLRELILELAVRGKLVQQDPRDEPASVLLGQISAEKARLVNEKKIKKPKPLPSIADEEALFELPIGWEWARLGTLGNVFNGNSVNARVKEQKYSGCSGLPFIATKDIGYGFEEIDYHNGINIPVGEAKFKVARKGAVLVCAEGGSAGKKCGISDQDICFGNKLFANELFGNINPKFVLATYLTPVFFQQFQASMTGIIGGISTSKFVKLLIPLPSLSEQHRIVAKVDELMALCDQLEQQTETSIDAHATLVETLLATLTNSAGDVQDAQVSRKAGKPKATATELEENWNRIAEHFDTLFTTEHSIDQLKQTILQLAVMGKLVQFSEKSLAGELKTFLEFGPRNGLSPKEAPIETNHKVLKLGATSYGLLDLDQTKYVDIEIETDSHLWLIAGDILIQRGNSHNFVGSNVLIEKDIDNVIYPDLMMKIRVKKHVLPAYISLWLKAPTSRIFMWERMTGTSGTMPKISKKVVENLPVLIPPLLEQEKLVIIVNQLMTLCDQIKGRLQHAQQTQLHLADALVEQAVG